MELPRAQLERIVADALNEDIGTGDLTTLYAVSKETRCRAMVVSRCAGVMCGTPVVREVLRQVDADLRMQEQVGEGMRFETGAALIEIEGAAQSILSAERVLLNFLQRMCGIATLTRQYVDAVAGLPVRIADTRKTTPGLRLLEKYAVRTGGGFNHRMGLYDAVMVKDNHIAAAGSITAAVTRLQENVPHTVTITVECETLQDVEEALQAGADILLLDNMSNETRRAAVTLVNGEAVTEASGGITLATVRSIAETGVDILSIGALTHSVPALDLGLDF
jgi:nicotinate-nucleotide pyrophosphorylase (carboxylating)